MSLERIERRSRRLAEQQRKEEIQQLHEEAERELVKEGVISGFSTTQEDFWEQERKIAQRMNEITEKRNFEKSKELYLRLRKKYEVLN